MAAGSRSGGGDSSGGSKDHLVAVIGDEETVAGFLLAGVGHRDSSGSNYLVVKKSTKTMEIQGKFQSLVSRNDIAVIVITQKVADEIRHVLVRHVAPVPVLIEIPDRETPYNAANDPVMRRVQQLLRSTGE